MKCELHDIIHLMSVDEAEYLVIEKFNKILTEHNKGFTFRVCSPESHWSRIEICGNCLGRRHWDSMLQVVNYFADIHWHQTNLYTDFEGLDSNDIFELLMKLDMKVE